MGGDTEMLEKGRGDSWGNKSGIEIRPIKATAKNIYKSSQIKQNDLILFAILLQQQMHAIYLSIYLCAFMLFARVIQLNCRNCIV